MLIELVVTVCLAGIASSCEIVRVPVFAHTVTQCEAESPQILALAGADHPSWVFKIWHCEKMQPPGKDA